MQLHCIESFDAAKAFRDTFRPTVPVAYSDMRSNQPVPPIVLQVANEAPIEEERNENVVEEAKPILVAAQLDECDIDALNELFTGENLAANSNDDDEQNDLSNAPISDEQLSSTNKEKVTEIIDDDIEMTYDEGQLFLPSVKSTPMVLKNRADELSGRMPYQAILDYQDVSANNTNYFVALK